MIAPWVGLYVGIPYVAEGRTRAGCDCYGLVRLILSEQLGILLPDFHNYEAMSRAERARLIDATLPLVDAAEVRDGDERIGDIALFRVEGHPCHVGVVCGDGYMVHTLGSHNSARELIRDRKWSSRREGFYRV